MDSDLGAAIAGARLLAGGLPAAGRVTVPLVVADSDSDAPVFAEDHFIPWCAIVPFDREEDAIRATAASPYGLGASVFSADETRARTIAGQLRAGIVSVNDIIAPTADPRLPFGGRAHSGHGVTRGAEGLLALTVPKVITRTRGKVRRHFQQPGEEEAALFRAGSALHHSGNISGKLRGLRAFLAALLALGRKHRP
jgi:acyl-CoA reductase-like NAD-dependent aldehyde dehydrogenase